MKTVCIQIGNSDNKLTQSEWANYCEDFNNLMRHHYEHERHFWAGSESWRPWQNLCLVSIVDESHLEEMMKDLATLRGKYQQESIAILIGNTEFI